MENTPTQRTIAIFFSTGALGDCARHALLAAIDNPCVGRIKLFARDEVLSTLDEPNWKCGCGEDHGASLVNKIKTLAKSKTVERISIDIAASLEDDVSLVKLQQNLDPNLKGVDAVISGLGNRQIFLGDRVAKTGTHNIVSAMERSNINRLVIMSSVGIAEDYPPMEWRFEGKIMKYLFSTFCRREYNDLLGAEEAVKKSKLNYLIVRPVGLGEDVVPKGEYFVQKKKYEVKLGLNMAKMDCGRFLLEEALNPTFEKMAVVLGSDPLTDEKK